MWGHEIDALARKLKRDGPKTMWDEMSSVALDRQARLLIRAARAVERAADRARLEEAANLRELAKLRTPAPVTPENMFD